VIGLTGSVERGRFGHWEEVCDILPRSYSTAIQSAGGMALVLPPDEAFLEAPDEALDHVDGLCLTGGSDIDPASYAAEPHPESKPTFPLRDAVEGALARRAVELDMPLLGTCRGMEMLNVALGGDLEQHLPERLGHARHSERPGFFGDHEVMLAPGSLAARAAGQECHAVKSFHHQGVGRLGQGLVATGWAVDEDLVEAIELEGSRFCLGVLWHPEEDPGSRVIATLVREAEAARDFLGRRRGETAEATTARR
jgi:putative glutamine amidotransferase